MGGVDMGRQDEQEEERDSRMATVHLHERREARYSVPIAIEVSGISREGQPFHERTFTLDVSEWGCGFKIPVELKKDDIVALRVVPGSSETAPLTKSLTKSLFQVVRVTPEDDGWVVGAWKMDDEKVWGAEILESFEREISTTGERGRRDTDS
jgi:hypothetical protein